MPKTTPRFTSRGNPVYGLSHNEVKEIQHTNGLDGDFERSSEWERDESPFPENPEVDPFIYGEDD